ncbi:chaperone modulator CbpM [Desulfobulbus alkaliphilus]|uniref:chaperone modulator CbpM n=1 Tax=Desulfobulbus alkaliphilus TaxID=869814 RepID=UPI0019661340|nr:chaperone modulator CbpM [Desulfobulbus alkaliphilus]MBM9536823.1 MerR family transcriptional regulator [Desulfobulbus alkaliphilus]
MIEQRTTYIQGIVLNEETLWTLAEICRLCDVSTETVLAMIDEGIISPRGAEPEQWCFTLVEIKRVQTAVRLQQDLRINLPGCALALDLLEELEELRRHVRPR